MAWIRRDCGMGVTLFVNGDYVFDEMVFECKQVTQEDCTHFVDATLLQHKVDALLLSIKLTALERHADASLRTNFRG
jgi:hypothetical protein